MKNILFSILLFSLSCFGANFSGVYVPPPGTSGNVLTSNGSRWTSVPAGAGVNFSIITWAPTANCQWATNSTSITTFPADADCPAPVVYNSGGTVVASAPATKIPAIKFASLPAGAYEVTVNANWGKSSGAADTCGFALYDGTSWKSGGTLYGSSAGVSMYTGFSKSAIFIYGSTQTNIEFQPAVISNTASMSCLIENYVVGVNVKNEMRIEVKKLL